MNNIERKVLRIIGESVSSPDVFSTITPIRDSINDAIEEICTVTPLIKNIYELRLINGVTFYRITPTDNQFCYVSSVYLPDKNRRLEQTSAYAIENQDPNWLSTGGTPYAFFNYGVNYIGIYPACVEDGHHAELEYVTLPQRYTEDISIIEVRSDYEDLLVSYAVAEYFLTIRDLDKYQRYSTVYNTRLRQLIGKTKYPEKTWRLRSYSSKMPRPMHGYI